MCDLSEAIKARCLSFPLSILSCVLPSITSAAPYGSPLFGKPKA